ncbi:MAG: ATP/GTP-binding protein [Candidatus Micrarchaeota archaeon]|nr:ATP/GTP-binding protein [Candidatus Micrarchaeota archaeon]
MSRILVCGPKSVGKSLLTYTFSRYLDHRKVSAKTVHLDPAAQRLSFLPDVDVRHSFKGDDAAEVLGRVFSDPFFTERLKALDANVVLMDAPSGLDWLLFSKWPKFFEAPWLVTAQPASRHLVPALEDAVGVPVLNVVNQRQRLSGHQKTLSLFSLSEPKTEKTVFVNAWEREGFVELHQHAVTTH